MSRIRIDEIRAHLSEEEWRTICEVAAYERTTVEHFCADEVLRLSGENLAGVTAHKAARHIASVARDLRKEFPKT